MATVSSAWASAKPEPEWNGWWSRATTEGDLAYAEIESKLNELYKLLDRTGKRVSLLENPPEHRLIAERRANPAPATGHPEQTIFILSTTPWPRELQRYVRSELWKMANAELGENTDDVPDFLNEDNLSPFGAYWSDT